jgi:GNAT superfamily N-acetyltransferase
MAIEILRVREEHIPELARICYEAFGALHDRHGVPRDFETPEVARMVVGLFASRPDFYGIAAAVDGRLVGSNFIQFLDPVSGVGPITVDPSAQSRGIGRRLMRGVMDEASRRGVSHVRLYQEAVNSTSLPLYTTLGFTWRDAAAVMQGAPAAEDDPTVRAMAAADLPGVRRLSEANYGHRRDGDAGAMLALPYPGFVREREGRMVGYLLPGFIGHGAAETEADMAALLGQAARRVDPALAKFLCPLSEAGLFRRSLEAGCRVLKVVNSMSVGEYRHPPGVWIPSIGC